MRSSCATCALWACLAALAGCGGDDDDAVDTACGVEVAVPGTSLEELGKLASISFQERQIPDGPIQRVANATFIDFTMFDADAAPTIAYDDVCSSVEGDQVVRVDPEILASPDSATITVGEDVIDFTEVATGRMQAEDLPAVAPGSPVAVSVVSGGGDDQFPSFDAEVDPSDAPSALSNEALPTGEMVLRWTPTGAEAIEVEYWVLDPNPETFHPLRCVVADDGCLTVNSAASLALFHDVVPTPLSIRVSAVRSAQWDGPDGEVGYFKVERRRDLAYEP